MPADRTAEPIAHGIYSLLMNLSTGARMVIQRQDADRKSTVALVDTVQEWEKFVVAIERGEDEVTAVHAIDDKTPVWHHEMSDVEGIAAHPSTQRMTVAQLRAKAAQHGESLKEARSFPPSDDKRELVKEWKTLRAAMNLAIEWRHGRG